MKILKPNRKLSSRMSCCSICRELDEKRRMKPLYTADSSSMPPKLLCYLCESCFCKLLDYIAVSM